MKKSKTIILKIASLFTVFFTCINIVNAKSNFIDKQTTNLYENCNESNKCIPLCVYNANPNDGDDISKNNSEIAYIGYYYSEHSWELGVIYYDRLLYTKSTIPSPQKC